jgi:hypothetical protein
MQVGRHAVLERRRVLLEHLQRYVRRADRLRDDEQQEVRSLRRDELLQRDGRVQQRPDVLGVARLRARL